MMMKLVTAVLASLLANSAEALKVDPKLFPYKENNNCGSCIGGGDIFCVKGLNN